jgi:hypothetical protein
MHHTIRQRKTKGSTPLRNLIIDTDRGAIRLAIYMDDVPCMQNNRGHDAPPPEVEITLRNLIAGQEDPITHETPNAEWVKHPVKHGFYVRYKRGEGLSELYYGGEDTPGEFINDKDNVGASFFGPFQIPL